MFDSTVLDSEVRRFKWRDKACGFCGSVRMLRRRVLVSLCPLGRPDEF